MAQSLCLVGAAKENEFSDTFLFSFQGVVDPPGVEEA